VVRAAHRGPQRDHGQQGRVVGEHTDGRRQQEKEVPVSERTTGPQVAAFALPQEEKSHGPLVLDGRNRRRTGVSGGAAVIRRRCGHGRGELWVAATTSNRTDPRRRGGRQWPMRPRLPRQVDGPAERKRKQGRLPTRPASPREKSPRRSKSRPVKSLASRAPKPGT